MRAHTHSHHTLPRPPHHAAPGLASTYAPYWPGSPHYSAPAGYYAPPTSALQPAGAVSITGYDEGFPSSGAVHVGPTGLNAMPPQAWPPTAVPDGVLDSMEVRAVCCCCCPAHWAACVLHGGLRGCRCPQQLIMCAHACDETKGGSGRWPGRASPVAGCVLKSLGTYLATGEARPCAPLQIHGGRVQGGMGGPVLQLARRGLHTTGGFTPPHHQAAWWPGGRGACPTTQVYTATGDVREAAAVSAGDVVGPAGPRCGAAWCWCGASKAAAVRG